MNESSSSQGIHRVPFGFLVSLFMVVIAERSYFLDNPVFTSTHAASWKYVDRHVQKKSQGREVLCFGDSLMKFGVLPPVLEEVSGLSAHNLAMFNAPTPANYFAFRRAIAAGAHPSAILIECAAGLLAEGPSSQGRSYPWAEFLDLGEAIELAWQAKDPDLLTRTLVSQVLPSFKARHEVRSHIRMALSGQRNHRAMTLALIQRNWNRNGGAQAQAKTDFHDYPPPEGESPEPSWRSDPVNAWFLERICDLALQNDIPVYWLLPPYSPGELAHQNHRGENKLYDQFIKTILRRYQNVVVFDTRESGYGKSLFFDHAHLNRDGAIALTAGVAEVLASPKTLSSPQARWKTLPLIKLVTNSVEDSAQSLVALKEYFASARR